MRKNVFVGAKDGHFWTIIDYCLCFSRQHGHYIIILFVQQWCFLRRIGFLCVLLWQKVICSMIFRVWQIIFLHFFLLKPSLIRKYMDCKYGNIMLGPTLNYQQFREGFQKIRSQTNRQTDGLRHFLSCLSQLKSAEISLKFTWISYWKHLLFRNMSNFSKVGGWLAFKHLVILFICHSWGQVGGC